MSPQDTRQRILAAHKLLTEQTTSREKFELIRTLIKGVSPRVDNALDSCSKTLSDIEKLQQGQIIELSAENLPENSEEEKKRKRAVLFFIRSWKQLQSEVERVKNEFEQHSDNQKVDNVSRILAGAKGPFGVITIAAVVIVGVFVFMNSSNKTAAPSSPTVKGESVERTSAVNNKIQIIEFNGKQIPLSETVVGQGSECENAEHYHAKDHVAARALGGTMVTDPGGCGFGKVSDVAIVEVEQ